LHRTAWTNAGGYPLGDDIHALRITLDGTPTDWRDWRALIDRIESLDEGRTSLQSPARDALVARIHAIRANLQRGLTIRYQRSLFDRRPDAEAASRDAIAKRLDLALARVLQSVDSTAAHGRSELVAAWPEHRW
jgi:hypothetical protein